MPEIQLSEPDQHALRSLMSAEAVVGSPLPSRRVLASVATLIPCEAIGAGLANSSGRVIDSVLLPSTRPGETDPQVCDGPLPVGFQRWGHDPRDADHLTSDGHVDALLLGFRNGADHVAQIYFGRARRPFSDRDLAMLRLITPLLKRHLQEPATTRLPASLTVQERRVLQLVATGRSNAEIANCLCVAPSTVRKHLEHAFPKLGVSNRLAAVVAFEGGLARDSDRVELVARFA